MKSRKSLRLINTSRQKKSSPLNVGDMFEGVSRALSDTGSGIVDHPCGLVVFVPGLWLGERAKLKITHIKKRFALAQVEQLLNPASERLSKTPCQYHGFTAKDCGGCSWMFMDYAAQLEAKHTRAVHALSRLQEGVHVASVIPSPKTLAYRMRAQCKTDGKTLGFVANGENTLVSVDQCAVLNKGCQDVYTSLREQLPNAKWQPAKKQRWRTLDFSFKNNTAEVSLDKRLPFAQANEAQNTTMHHWLSQGLAALDKTHKVVELFAGSGNFTQVISSAGFTDLVAVEVVEEATKQLKNLDLAGAQVECTDLFNQDSSSAFWRRHQNCKILVLDPPRDGMKEKAGLFEKARQLEHVFYISCDLATLCRDLKHFLEHQFVIAEAQPIDMFPQTPHLEMLVHLRKLK